MPDQDGVLGAEEREASKSVGIVSSRPIVALSDETLQAQELVRQYNAAVAAISSLSWGRGMTPGIQRSVAAYCQRNDIDPMTELDVLGGNFYVTSEWFLRKLGEMRRRGVVADFWIEHIQADPRLKALIDDEAFPAGVREEARRRWTDMLFKRIEHNAPEEAKAVAVAYITLPSGGHPITGCKWGGGGTSVPQPRSGGGSAPNPIVENNPTLSVESQAIRRAMRQLASHAGGAAPDVERMESELTGISARLTAVVDRQEEVNNRLDAEAHEPKALLDAGFVGYAGESDRSSAAPPVDRDAAVAEANRALVLTDPYQEPNALIFREPGKPIMPPGMELRETAPIALEQDGAPATARSREAAREEYLRATGDEKGAVARFGEGADWTRPAGDISAHYAVVGGEIVDLARAPAPVDVDAIVNTTVVTCAECGRDVRVRHPEDHAPGCSKYAD